ncbi:complement factor H-like isoform X4 [Desmodus rotundus]|uniref:complement factor H-like isoform X4 n=1 Tax=Desmodus rotundus TaxID=9430 RepID=UPI0023814420|nr:complement factor H-like isoform X4 [Desmodus rotundus]
MRVNTPSGTPNMLLSLITVIVALWASRAHGQETTCDPPTIANGFYAPHRTKYRLEDEITYRCDNSFAPASRGNKTRCTDRGWRPSPRCISVGQWYYYSCDDNYVTPVTQLNWAEIICTPEGWLPDIPCLRPVCRRHLPSWLQPPTPADHDDLYREWLVPSSQMHQKESSSEIQPVYDFLRPRLTSVESFMHQIS